MRVPLSWLKDYVDITLSPSDLAEKLTLAGLEVEHIEFIGLPGGELPWDRDKIFVGQLLQVERHPNADRLLLATIEYGAPQPIVVVTGAPNIKPGDSGQKVVLALKGSRLYDGHKEGKVLITLKEANLRGIKNDSMVCSAKELGLSEEHDGIILLPGDAPVGSPLADYLGDAVLDIAILPNVARCASIIGVAREVAALTGQTLRYPQLDFVTNGSAIENELAIEIRDSNLNPRFTASIIRNIAPGQSPYWVQQRLQLCGIRAISNVVDISNFVMLEIGHPTHTFDLEGVRVGPSGKRTIVTRTALPDEKLTTLDGQVRELQPNDILVCDELGPLGLAGVMGGAESEVKGDTTSVLLEVAAWDNISIRRTARRFNLNSEASARFARGIHPSQAMLAQKRGLHLLQRICGGVIDTGLLDVYPNPAKVVTIDLHPEHVTRLLGVAIPVEEMVRILQALEFTVVGARGRTPLHVTAPDHRLDIEGEHDLIEEIARIYGYDKLPTTLMNDALPNAHGTPELSFEERLKDVLVEAGLQEIVTYRMTTPEAEMRAYAPGTPADDKPYVQLLNPITPDRAAMRHTLLPGMLEMLQNNVRQATRPRTALFEVGSVYIPGESGVLPDELPRLAISMTGRKYAPSWADAPEHASHPESLDFFDMKGVVETVLNGLTIRDVKFETASHPSFYPGRTAAIVVNGKQVGVFGEAHPKVREAWAMSGDAPVLLADVDLTALRAAVSDARAIADVPRFPATTEDLAIVVSEDVKAADVEMALQRAGGNLLRGITLFDVYRGEQIGTGKKSLAYSLMYQADDRTLERERCRETAGQTYPRGRRAVGRDGEEITHLSETRFQRNRVSDASLTLPSSSPCSLHQHEQVESPRLAGRDLWSLNRVFVLCGKWRGVNVAGAAKRF